MSNLIFKCPYCDKILAESTSREEYCKKLWDLLNSNVGKSFKCPKCHMKIQPSEFNNITQGEYGLNLKDTQILSPTKQSEGNNFFEIAGGLFLLTAFLAIFPEGVLYLALADAFCVLIFGATVRWKYGWVKLPDSSIMGRLKHVVWDLLVAGIAFLIVCLH